MSQCPTVFRGVFSCVFIFIFLINLLALLIHNNIITTYHKLPFLRQSKRPTFAPNPTDMLRAALVVGRFVPCSLATRIFTTLT